MSTYRSGNVAGSTGMNYDFNSLAAKKKDINIATGIDCVNCYVVVGGTYSLDIQYYYNGYVGAQQYTR